MVSWRMLAGNNMFQQMQKPADLKKLKKSKFFPF